MGWNEITKLLCTSAVPAQVIVKKKHKAVTIIFWQFSDLEWPKSQPKLSIIQSASLYSSDTSELLELKFISMFISISELLTTVVFEEFFTSPAAHVHESARQMMPATLPSRILPGTAYFIFED